MLKRPKRRQWLIIVNFEHISHLCSIVSIVNYEQVNAGWVNKWFLHQLTTFKEDSKPVEP